MSIARIWEKIDRVITTPHCIKGNVISQGSWAVWQKNTSLLDKRYLLTVTPVYWRDSVIIRNAEPPDKCHLLSGSASFFNNSSPPLRSILKMSTQSAKNLTKERMFRSPVNVIIMPLLRYAPAGLTNTLCLCLHITRSCLSKIHMSTEWVTSNTIFGRGYVIEKPCSNILLWSQMLSKLIPSIGNNRNND